MKTTTEIMNLNVLKLGKNECYSDFNTALLHSEQSALRTLDGHWAVCVGHGVFLSCPLSYAIENDYAITCITIY